MMYLPKHFEVTDETTIREFVANNSFGTLVTVKDGLPEFSRAPMLWHDGFIHGHIALVNPQSEAVKQGEIATAVFDGPHAYISSRWYATHYPIPTWNFATVIIRGELEAVEGQESIDLIKQLVATYDDPTQSPYKEVWDDANYWKRLTATIGYRLHVREVKAKFKLSQNKDEEDRASVRQYLSASELAGDRAVANLMAYLIDDESSG